MWELRWVLLALGVLLIAMVYVLGRGLLRWQRKPRLPRPPERVEPTTAGLADTDDRASDPSEPDHNPPDENSSKRTEPPPAQQTDRIVTIRFVPKEGELGAEEVVVALRKAGLTHGRYGIFHRHDNGSHESSFCVANLTEPGSFELSNLADQTIPGMSFFMVLPGSGDPVERFDLMVQTARSMAHDLEAELHDEKGSSWSIQRERYVREEIIRYRHQLELS
jgi:cell division protein ZipA